MAQPGSIGSGQAPIAPMEALLVKDLPEPPGWQYEPKWDGFRAIVAREADRVELWSKSGKPLGRYFPEVIERIRALAGTSLLLDGELVIALGGCLSFDALQARLHPAASRVARLSRETPAQLILFDCLRVRRRDLLDAPLLRRRGELESLLAKNVDPSIKLSPASTDLNQARSWLEASGGALDGVIAKPLDQPYRPGERSMRKVKQLRTADCVVGGYRLTADGTPASLLLGLYDESGRLDLVGFCAGFSAAQRESTAALLARCKHGAGFTGKAPGGPSRWNVGKNADYMPLDHELVAEVVYDQITNGRFRHGARFLRWRPDKAPRQCTHDQLVRELAPAELLQLVDQLK